LQDQNAPHGTFLHRTDALAVRLGLRVEDLPSIIGISRRTLFVCRSADSAVTSKSWRKLEAAERAAGIRQDAVPEDLPIAASFTNLNDLLPDLPGKDSEFVFFPEPTTDDVQAAMSRIAQMSAELASIQSKLASAFAPAKKTIAEFPMDELRRHMMAAGAWPYSKEDGKLTPAQLWQKYAPPTNQPAQDSIRAPGSRKRDLEEP
jgi:hypothetical protein